MSTVFKNGKGKTGAAFPCECGGSFDRVLDSRGRASGFVYRVRVCRCGKRLRTHERPMGQIGQDEYTSAMEALIEASNP